MLPDIQPKLIPLGELIQNRLFEIPDYQRTYSWGEREREALFEDIRKAHDKGPDRTHFMSTIVGLRRESLTIGTDDHSVVEIVDGQQRITTLLILLKAVSKAAGSSKADRAVNMAVQKEIDNALVKRDEVTLLLLQTNHDTSDHFKKYMREGTHPESDAATTLADREILAAMEDCEAFVADWLNDGLTLIDLVRLLKNRLAFILYEVGDEKLVYTAFEILNSRGLPVSWFDRLKSMLMANVFESDEQNKKRIIDEVHKGWINIYQCVGLRLGLSTESMRATETLWTEHRPSKMLGEEDAATKLATRSIDGLSVIRTTDRLKDVTVALDAIARDHRLSGVTNIAHARMVAVAMNLREDMSSPEKEAIHRKWENVTFRIYGLIGKDARWRVGDYVRLAWDITKRNLSTDDILFRLDEIGAEFPIDQAVDNLKGADCYNDWSTQLRYFFRRYEEYLAVKNKAAFKDEQWNRIWEKSPSNSIEHIRPQSEYSDDGYRKMHSIGNLMILPPGLNSKLQNKPVSEKADEYTKTGLFLAREVADLVAQWNIKSHWTPEAIEDREQALLDWARQEWAD